MSYRFRIRHLRHFMVSVLIALILLVVLTPLQPQNVPSVAPPSPPPLVVWPTTVPTQQSAVSVDPPPAAGPSVAASQAPSSVAMHSSATEFNVYLPQLTYSDVPSPDTHITAMRSQDQSSCLEYRDIRITWYELGSCCNKAPDHPAYGITRSGLTVQWGMAAVQADTPLVPLGTTVIIKDLGSTYPMVVTDTGSETAFGSAWLDVYAPSEAIGYWLEQQIGLDGRSDVLVCPTSALVR